MVRGMALAAPTSAEADNEWAKKILVRWKTDKDPDWLLASVLKVLEVKGLKNERPGMACYVHRLHNEIPSLF